MRYRDLSLTDAKGGFDPALTPHQAHLSILDKESDLVTGTKAQPLAQLNRYGDLPLGCKGRRLHDALSGIGVTFLDCNTIDQIRAQGSTGALP
jgi:hypothetical protein